VHQDDYVMLRLAMHELLNFKYFHDLNFFLKTKSEKFREIWGALFVPLESLNITKSSWCTSTHKSFSSKISTWQNKT
jgi:hypothetical protein